MASQNHLSPMESLQTVMESKHENKIKNTQSPGISNDLRIMSDSE